MRANLTHSFVEALKPPATGQTDYWDAKTAGFGLRVSMRGTKSWLVRYRQHGHKRRLLLGRFPQMSLADARQGARRSLGEVATGNDPAEARAEAKGEPTFADLAELYVERHAKVKKAPRSIREDQYMLDADLLPIWSGRKLSDIKRKDTIALLDDIVARGAPIHANRVRALVSTMFNFAVGRDLAEHNPT